MNLLVDLFKYSRYRHQNAGFNLEEFRRQPVEDVSVGVEHLPRLIVRLLDAYVERNPGRAVAHTSLGQQRYLSALKHADAVVGNSSSGLIEAPSLHTPTVDVGDRQRGRLVAGSVVRCGNEVEEIRAAIERALSPAFRAALPGVRNPYGEPGASGRIKEVLKSVALDARMLKKRFHVAGAPR